MVRDKECVKAVSGEEVSAVSGTAVTLKSKKKGWCVLAFSCLPYSTCWKNEPKLGRGNNSSRFITFSVKVCI